MSDFNISLGIKLNENDLKRVKQQIDSLNVTLNIKPTNPNELNRDVSQMGKQLSSATTKIASKAATDFNKSFVSHINLTSVDEIRTRLASFKMDTNSIDKATASLQNLKVRIDDIDVTDMDGLTRIDLTGIDMYGRKVKATSQELANGQYRVTQSIRTSIASERELVEIEQRRSRLIAQIATYQSRNDKIGKNYNNQLEAIKNTMDMSDGVSKTKEEVVDAERKFRTLKAEIKASGQEGQRLSTHFKKIVKQMSTFITAYDVVRYGMRVLRAMVSNVREIDTAMTNLYKVTNETEKSYNRFLKDASKNAKVLGRDLVSVIDQTAQWAKLGYGLNEATQLSKTSSIYANVGEVDDDTAVSDIVTAMKAFNIEASNSIIIVDRLNQLGNKYAVSSADLGDGLKRSASALAMAGNSIDESLALITGGSEITQNASEMGNSLKIVSMRLRGKHNMPPYKESLYALL